MSLFKPVSILRSIQKVAVSSKCTTNGALLTASYRPLNTSHLWSWSQRQRLLTLQKTQFFHTTVLQAEKNLNTGADNSQTIRSSIKDGKILATNIAAILDSDESTDKTDHLVPSGHKVLELLDENDEPLGSVPRDEAIAMSKERKLKLVLVNPQSRPYPMYRLMSHEKFNQEHVNIKEKLKKLKTVVKEVRISCGIGEHDLQVKKRHMKGWFDDDKHEVHVKVVVKGGKSFKKVTEEEQLAIVHRLLSGMEDHITFGNKPKAVGKHNPSLVVQLRRMSNKEKKEFNKQKNMEQS